MKFPSLAVSALALALTACGSPDETRAQDSVFEPAAERAVPRDAAEVKASFAPVVRSAAPAVVNISARGVQTYRDPFWGQFRQQPTGSVGSGVIVRADGVVVTNTHVIQGMNEIVVGLNDRRQFTAKVLLADERSDIAVLQLQGVEEPLPVLRIDVGEDQQIGDLVLAIGNPFGVGQTVTSGIVSALSRTQVGVSDYQFFIQTDAAINPGNSGGALIDMAGRLVGINTAIYSRTGGSIGIGFAVPVNMVASVVRSISTGGKIVRPWVGAEVQEVTAEIADSLGFDRPRGALIVTLHRLSPLHRAGIRRGDVVIEVDKRPIEDARAMTYRLATATIGKSAEIAYLRGGMRNAVSVRLIAPPETPAREETLIQGQNPFAGLVAWNLSPATAEELSLSPTDTGVAIADIKGGPAARVGFRRGDILVDINGQEIDNVKTLARLLARDDRYWAFTVSRGGRLMRMQLGG